MGDERRSEGSVCAPTAGTHKPRTVRKESAYTRSRMKALLEQARKRNRKAIQSRSARRQRRKSDLWTPYDSTRTASRNVATQSRASLPGEAWSTVLCCSGEQFEFGTSILTRRRQLFVRWLRSRDSEKRRKPRTRGERDANSSNSIRDGRMGQRRANPRDTCGAGPCGVRSVPHSETQARTVTQGTRGSRRARDNTRVRPSRLLALPAGRSDP